MLGGQLPVERAASRARGTQGGGTMLKGIVETAPATHHAGGPGAAADAFWAICGVGRVTPIDGSFDLADTQSCVNCARLVRARTG